MEIILSTIFEFIANSSSYTKEFAINSKTLHKISSILFVCMNVRLKEG